MYLFSTKKLGFHVAIIVCSFTILLSQVSLKPITGNPDNGRMCYSMNNCTSCHGEKGENGMAPTIAGLDMGFGSFLKVLRKPDSVSKPIYPETKISKQDAIDMYVWLKGTQ